MKDLQNQRNEKARQLYAAEDRLTALRKERARAIERERTAPGSYYSPADQAPNRVTVNQVPQSVEMSKTISSLERSISDMRSVLAGLDREIAFIVEVDSADNALQVAREALAEAEDTAAELQRKRQLVTQKLQHIQAEHDSELESARALESEATDAYASAVGEGDARAESAATAKLRKATAALQEAQAKQPGMQKVVDALEDEADALDSQLAAKIAEVAEVRSGMFRAAAIKLGVQWDKTAAELIEIGGKLLAAQQLCGMVSKPMEDLHLPLFSAYQARPLGVREVKEKAAVAEASSLAA
jgi:DNA repair exonuclease SbcCD ATPase subunit